VLQWGFWLELVDKNMNDPKKILSDQECDIYIGEILDNCPLQLILAVLAPVVSLIFDYLYSCHEPLNLFQRSGAISVVICVWIQFKLVKIDSAINPSAANYSTTYRFREKFLDKYDKISGSTLAILIISTLIWGYGDLILRI